MAVWVCADCTTAYSVGAPRCPHCQATTYLEPGDTMPKITVAGGASSRHDPETAGAVEPPASTAPAPTEGGASSPGNSSSASPERPEPSSEPSETAPRSPARKTASRSKKAPTDSSAPGTDGDQADATPEA